MVVEGERSRAIATIVQCTDASPSLVYSVYLHHGEGMSERNVKLMATVAEHAARASQPFLIAGDWNMEPSKVSDVWLPDVLRARVVATASCRDTAGHARGYSNLDLFVVRADLAEAVADVGVAWDAPTAPH